MGQGTAEIAFAHPRRAGDEHVVPGLDPLAAGQAHHQSPVKPSRAEADHRPAGYWPKRCNRPSPKIAQCATSTRSSASSNAATSRFTIQDTGISGDPPPTDAQRCCTLASPALTRYRAGTDPGESQCHSFQRPPSRSRGCPGDVRRHHLP